MKLRADAKDWASLPRATFEWIGRFVDQFNKHDDALAALDNLGSYLESVVADSSITLATATPKNITSLALPVGSWAVFGDGMFGGVPTGGTDLLLQTTTTSAAFQSANGFSQSAFESTTMPSAGVNIRASLAPRLVVSTQGTPATAYLVSRGTFTGGSLTAGGGLRAWRVG